MGVALLTSMNGSEEAYTKEQFIADMEADRVSEVVVRPNSEVPTGYLAVELRSGAERKLYVTDIGEAEALVRDHGFDPVVKDVPREGWVLTTLVPMLIVLAVGIFLFMMINAQNAAGGSNKMMNFGKSRARMAEAAEKMAVGADNPGCVLFKDAVTLYRAEKARAEAMEQRAAELDALEGEEGGAA